MRLFGRNIGNSNDSDGGGNLKCPYKGCEKHFNQPTVITDTSTIPRQTHYACPHCMSKLEIVTQNMKVINVKAMDYPTVFESPAKCAHFNGGLGGGYLGSGNLADECLVCPKAMLCDKRK
jgi:hypothetical protein